MRHIPYTPPKFNSLPLKNDGWKTFLLGRAIFRGELLNFGRVFHATIVHVETRYLVGGSQILPFVPSCWKDTCGNDRRYLSFIRSVGNLK